MSQRYRVLVPEVWYQAVEIEAGSEEEARQLAMNANGEMVAKDFSYSHTLEEPEQFIVQVSDTKS